MLQIGDMLQNRYEVSATIKAGGMGAVYRVFDRRLHTVSALKVAFATTPAEQALFQHEAQLLARLSHPVLPRVTDHFSEGGEQCLVMDLVEGDDLETLLERQGQPFDPAMVLAWADQLLDALQYLHTQQPPIIHRDIKPANLKPLRNGGIKLLDFGIAKQHIVGSRTVAAAQAVTPEYSPPEQWSGATTEAHSDIYALGATMYHLLTNRAPPSALARLQGTRLVSPDQLNNRCSPALAQAMLQAMALNVADRFGSAAAFRAALRSVSALVEQVPTVMRRPRRRRILIATLGATAVVAGLGVAAFLLFPQRPPQSPAPVAAFQAPATPTPRAAVVAATAPTTAVPTFVAPPTPTVPTPTALPSATLTSATAPTPSLGSLQEINLSSLASASASSVLAPETTKRFGVVRFDPSNVLDRNPTTVWVEGVADSGTGQRLVLNFPQPIISTRLGINVGFDRDEAIFYANNRVRRVQVVYDDGSVQRAEFLDQRGLQFVPLPNVATNSLTLVIEEVYRGSAYDDTVIAEIEVWGATSR